MNNLIPPSAGQSSKGYEAPELVDYGTVSQLTRTSPGLNTSDPADTTTNYTS